MADILDPGASTWGNGALERNDQLFVACCFSPQATYRFKTSYGPADGPKDGPTDLWFHGLKSKPATIYTSTRGARSKPQVRRVRPRIRPWIPASNQKSHVQKLFVTCRLEQLAPNK